MSSCYRVFGLNDLEPEPARLETFLRRLSPDAECHFQADDQGWFRAQFLVDDAVAVVERYLVTEEGIREELNTWAAWVETAASGPEQAELMERLIRTRQLLLLTDLPEEHAGAITSYLAQLTDGIYQADGRGLFATSGELLVSEREGR